MALKLALTVAMALWKTGLPEKAIKYIYDKANVILLDERSDRESFQVALEHYSDDELMVYVPDVYQVSAPVIKCKKTPRKKCN